MLCLKTNISLVLLVHLLLFYVIIVKSTIDQIYQPPTPTYLGQHNVPGGRQDWNHRNCGAGGEDKSSSI